jgi:aryl-alcohol dehydrogenase-like predicted oxidoreductase
VYGHGESEKILGWMARKSERSLTLATKFAPLPGRGGAAGLSRALDASLRRLGVASVDLYQVHWCDTDVASIESLMHALADAVQSGRVRAVGVSNFSATEMRRAHEVLAQRGVSLASNQVEYSLLHRAPERDGVLSACRELGVTLIAYSPLAQGILSGKYAQGSVLPEGPRREQSMFALENLTRAEGLVGLLREIGEHNGARNPDQVALNWLLRQPGVVVIPGAKTGAQAARNAGAWGWRLTDEDAQRIEEASRPWL